MSAKSFPHTIPLWARRGGGGGPPGTAADHQTAKFIVGNELAGDTIDVCDFLDPGNCTGIAAALAAATALGTGCDIYLRPGTYDTTAVGAPTLPMELPPSGFDPTPGPATTIRTAPSPRLMIGLGGFHEPAGARIVVGDQRHIFAPTGVSVVDLEGLFFDVLPSEEPSGDVMVGGPTGPGSVLIGTFTRCQVRLPSEPSGTETLRYLFFMQEIGGQFASCDILGAYKNGEFGGTFLTAISAATLVSDCTVVGVDYCVIASDSGLTAVNNLLSGSDNCIYSESMLIAHGNYFEYSGSTGLTVGGGSVIGNTFVGPGSTGTAVMIVSSSCTFTGNTLGFYADGLIIEANECSVSGNTFLSTESTVGILVTGGDNVITGNIVHGDHTVGISIQSTANNTLITGNNIVGATVADIDNVGIGTVLGPLLRGLQPPTSAAACPVGVVDEMRGNAAGFTVSTAVRPVAVPTTTENVWGNYNAAQLDGGWWVGVDATRWKFGCGRASDSSVVENFSGGELTDYPPGAFLNKLFLLTIRVSGTTGELFVNDRLVSTITLTGGYQPATLGLAPMIHTNNNGAVPRLVIGVPFVAGGYVEAVLTNAEIRDNYYAMQRGGSLAPTASGAQWTSIYNVYNDPTTNGITDLLAVGGAFTAVDPIGVDELRIMW